MIGSARRGGKLWKTASFSVNLRGWTAPQGWRRLTALGDQDFEYAHTVRGDSIDLEFDAGRLEPGPEETADYFFVSEGYYHGLRTYLYPDVDTSDSYRDDVNGYIEELNRYLAGQNR